jgi:hypothetical protein
MDRAMARRFGSGNGKAGLLGDRLAPGSVYRQLAG